MKNELKTVTRYEDVSVCGHPITCAIMEDGEGFFSPRHVCDALGIGWTAQFEKIKEDQVLGSVVREIPTTAADGKSYKMMMLPASFLSGWLFTIKKVKPEIQGKLNQFRAEGFMALDAWFRQGLRNDSDVLAKFNIPKTMAEALRLAADLSDKNDELEATVKELAPKAEFHDVLLADPKGTITMNELAKIFSFRNKAKNTFVGGVQLFGILRLNGWLMHNNQPYQRHINSGYFMVKMWYKNQQNGIQTMVTLKGARFLYKKLKAMGYQSEKSLAQVEAEFMAAAGNRPIDCQPIEVRQNTANVGVVYH